MVKVKNLDLTAAEVRELFSYNPATGVLTKKKSRLIMAGRNLRIGGVHYLKSRIIWLHFYGKWPDNLVDHINRDQRDNRILNLRDATHTQNQYNKIGYGSYGSKGIAWRNRQKKPWLAKIRIDGRRIHLGSFETKEQAARAYEEACLKHHGPFAQLRVK